jgi:peptidoglycan hydrolase-like protein with peptidoglycan-binding domain
MKTVMAMAAAVTLMFVMTTTPGFAAGDARVERAQQALRDAGHDPGSIDGVMGARTTAALKAYQEKQGLPVTGQLDDATAAKLSSGHAAASPSSTQTGGDTKASSVDPAAASTTGANAGEGASYSRSTEKGLSTLKDAEQKRK